MFCNVRAIACIVKAATTRTMTKEVIEAAIAQYYNSLAAMNPEGWLEILADDALIYDPVNKPPVKIGEDSQKFFDLLSRFYQEFKIVRNSVFVVELKAAVKWTMQVKAKNNRTATAEGITLFECNDLGKITLIQSYWDEAGFKAELMG
jgi:hypothetical protein